MNRQQDQNDLLHDFTSRLDKLGIEYMLTGSMALAHYAMPRTTVDIDIVIAIDSSHESKFEKEFGTDFYIPIGSFRDAISERRMFNVLDHRTILKIDCVVKKGDHFAETSFERRRKVLYTGSFEIFIISKEDLIISKLNWAKMSHSEKQLTDVANLIRNPFDEAYVKNWTDKLDLVDLLNECYRSLDRNNVD